MKKSCAHINEQVAVTSVDINALLAVIESAVKADKATVERMAAENRQAAYDEQLWEMEKLRNNEE